MSSRQKKWKSVDKASTPIASLLDRCLSACRPAGMGPKIIHGYNEKLKRYVRIVGGALSDG
jgi:hypothetical protein